MLSFKEALKLGTSLPRTNQTHTLPLFEGLNAILAHDVHATRALPPFDNSAMDGYAIMLADYHSLCACEGTILAGESAASLSLKKGHTYKVMTGSQLPQNTQAVVQHEWVEALGDNKVRIPALDSKHTIAQGQNIRFKGEEIAADSLLLRKGKRLNHLDLSILASQGISQITSFIPLKIAIFSSGDEVIEPSMQAKPHQIYNTNATSLYTLLHSYGYNCEYKGILADDKQALNASISTFGKYDVVITSGGASVGDADLIKDVLKAQGAQFIFDGVNTKPGRHLALATLNKTLIILLPGNPLALLLHLHTLILPILESMQGAYAYYPKSLTFKLDKPLKLKPNTTCAILGTIHNDTFKLFNDGKIGSSSLVNMWQNNAIALFENLDSISAGSGIKVILYNTDFCDIMDFINL
ncbi:molybdopterin molybdenumtransferase MoeA [Helicobacter jaachi]|uniref:Molybdopterin molybdenumtransferase n=1 Tax=Helicobacter jaachi TaxID=1677920 RepID=A0A4U8TAY8_9HELI|nr:molybdopterin molybdotransferase MoeA [Helicobacter jaachi]TLD96893.1 molybdopterin molybdenumtransferase MoeA [Helicobacter jaachi]